MQVTSYIFFNGKCAEALAFYEKVLGAKVEAKMTYGESPAAAHTSNVPRDNIIHARFKVGNSTILASDGETPPAAARFALCIHSDKAAEAERVFRDLAEGGQVRMKMDKTFFAARFGMATDKFGIPWMVICEKEAA